ncbi:pantoate--beta-alanine ligase [Pseudohongiella spirulinae]|uniref:Pantothenate synthetase n=1 Tax=Pseudohongiella spirulinae TaxID=1249552 RepID=A0A0S2KFU7_9GAMM|nr:pantoate--beta-alanine ligase [Pseudohongiella spirulinae]ALO46995.1 Pantothenate synthetase [Pseudohongiella spirulinae]
MQICFTTESLRQALNGERHKGNTIAVVPTMGNLHAGHIKLVHTANELADITVATIFVNPMQFGRNEDLDKYPRTPDADINKLTQAGCDYLFTPPVSEIYPDGLDRHTVVTVPGISERYCGASRPGHFDGVATVVSKLFNLVQPDHAVFGLKDYQQFQVIRKMTLDLRFPITLTGVATEREPSGLAMSSRNGYLSSDEKITAAQLYRTLQDTAKNVAATGNHFRQLESDAVRQLQKEGLRPDYFSICDAHTLEPADDDTHRHPGQKLVILAAAYIGNTRLIDNLELTLTA